MDAVTAVSGSGPAYVFLLAEELARRAVGAEDPTLQVEQTNGGTDRVKGRLPLSGGKLVLERGPGKGSRFGDKGK